MVLAALLAFATVAPAKISQNRLYSNDMILESREVALDNMNTIFRHASLFANALP